MNDLRLQTTEHLLILLKAIKEHDSNEVDFEKHLLVTEVIKVLRGRLKFD